MRLVERLRALGWRDGEQVVLAVSGGLDSMVLLDRATREGLQGVVAHVNYGLRGGDSAADARLVAREAARRGWPCRVAHRAVPRENLQAEARRVRYAWMEGLGAWVVTAHHAEDQAETVLLHLVRAADPVAAVAGMPARRGRVLRPMLAWPRAELRAWAEAHGVLWREDASNAEGKYLRNRIRHEVLPLLESLRPGTGAHLARMSERARAVADDLDQITHPASPTHLPWTPDAPFFLERLWAWGRLHGVTGEALSGLTATGAVLPTPTGTIHRDRDGLTFVAEAPASRTVHIDKPADGAAEGVRWEVLAGPPAALKVENGVCLLDAAAVVWPLTLRPWQPGDRLAPCGFDGHQLVSDLLTQAKVPPSERAAQRVLVDAAGTVHWLVGLRASRAAALTPSTHQTLRFTAP